MPPPPLSPPGTAIAASLSSDPGEVAVDGGTGNAELRGDFGDGIPPFPVLAGLLIHLSCQLDLAGAEFGFLPAGPAAGPCRGQAVHRPLRHQGVLELGDPAPDLEKHPP